jgi:hypothetical protein
MARRLWAISRAPTIACALLPASYATADIRHFSKPDGHSRRRHSVTGVGGAIISASALASLGPKSSQAFFGSVHRLVA